MIASVGLALDQVSKAVAVDLLALGPSHVGPLHLRLVANRGILLGIVALPVWTMTVITLVVVGVATRTLLGGPTPRRAVGAALLTAGALGNLVDRLVERPGFPANAVVDWLSLGRTTFNIADVLLVAAAILLLGSASLPTDRAIPVAVADSRAEDRPHSPARARVRAPSGASHRLLASVSDIGEDAGPANPEHTPS